MWNLKDYTDFVKTWLERAIEEREIDKADRFICLWIAFNASLKQKYGEERTDSELIYGTRDGRQGGLINDTRFISIFEHLKENNKKFKISLDKLERAGKIDNMRFPNDETKAKEFLGNFKTFIEVLYQIRCNLFHGRKDMKDISDKEFSDKELVFLAYDLLLPLFISYCKSLD